MRITSTKLIGHHWYKQSSVFVFSLSLFSFIIVANSPCFVSLYSNSKVITTEKRTRLSHHVAKLPPYLVSKPASSLNNYRVHAAFYLLLPNELEKNMIEVTHVCHTRAIRQNFSISLKPLLYPLNKRK